MSNGTDNDSTGVDFTQMTSEEIAGYFYDIQSPNIGEGSEYYGGGDARDKFISDYSSVFSTYEGNPEGSMFGWSQMDQWGNFETYTPPTYEKPSHEFTQLKLRTEHLDLAEDMAYEDFEAWKVAEGARISGEEKWWQEDPDDEFTSSAELRRAHGKEQDTLEAKFQTEAINRVAADYSESRDAAHLKSIQSGVRGEDLITSLKETLWESVEQVKDDFGDAKVNRQKNIDREIVDNKRNIAKGKENLAAQTKEKSAKLAQLSESQEVEHLFNREESANQFGNVLWSKMRRLMKTGIFDAEITPIIPDSDLPDVPCCFPAGTQVDMASGATKNIEDIKVGDYVKSFDEDSGEIVDREVQGLESPMRDNMATIKFKDGKELQVTTDHPLYARRTEFTGWGSIDNTLTREGYFNLSQTVELIELKNSDSIFQNDKTWNEIVSIEVEQIIIKTYSLSDVEGHHNFFAGGFLAHNRCHVTTELTNQGVWAADQYATVVEWCSATHHDGSARGEIWASGYDSWGLLLSKIIKMHRSIRFIVDIATDAFLDVVKRGKFNLLGYFIHHAWINPLSYVIGLANKNKVIGITVLVLMAVLYTILLPIYTAIMLPYGAFHYSVSVWTAIKAVCGNKKAIRLMKINMNKKRIEV